MKKAIFFLIVLLVSSIQYVQSQHRQIFATDDFVTKCKDGSLVITGAKALSLSEGISLIRTRLTILDIGTPADEDLLVKYSSIQKPSDPASVKLLTQAFKDDTLTLEELSSIKVGYYFLEIADKGKVMSRLLPFEVAEGKMPLSTFTDKEKKSSAPEKIVETKYVIIIFEREAPPAKKTSETKETDEKVEIADDEEDDVPVEMPARTKESSDKRMYVLSEEEVGNEKELFSTTTQEKDDCEVRVIPSTPEKKEVVDVAWPVAYMKLHVGSAFEKTDLAVDKSGTSYTPTGGFSAGWYFVKHLGIGAGTYFAGFERQKFVTTLAVPGGSVYGLITQQLDGSSVAPFGEIVFRPLRQFTITGIGGVNFLSLTSSVREDIVNTMTGALEVKGVPFKEYDLGRMDTFFGLGLDFCFNFGLSIGARSTISIAGETIYPSSVPQAVRDNPPEVLSPQGKIQADGILLSIGWQF